MKSNKYMKQIKEFFHNKRHIEAIVLTVVIIIIIAVVVGRQAGGSSTKASGDATTVSSKTDNSKKAQTKSDGGKTSYKKEDKGSDLHDLLADYYKDFAAGDTASLEKVASPVSDMEKSYIKFMSKLIDSYDIKEIYTKDGADNNAKLVSVYEEMHFKNLKSAAPGLDFFYVEKDSSGALHINNLYSSFNQTYRENDMDPSVVSTIASFEEQKDVVNLQTKVQKEFNEISLSDKDFDDFMNKTYPSKVKSWQSNYRKQAKKEEAAKKKAESEKKAKEEAASQTKAEKAAVGTKYKTTSNTNLRKHASTTADIIKTLKKGTKVTIKGSKGNWLKVSFKGKTGYIRKDYLKKATKSSAKKSTATKTSSKKSSTKKKSVSGIKEGQKIMLKESLNIRKKPSTKAKRLNLAYAGEKVLVLKIRDDGWARVQYHHKKGYAKIDYLK